MCKASHTEEARGELFRGSFDRPQMAALRRGLQIFHMPWKAGSDYIENEVGKGSQTACSVSSETKGTKEYR